MFILREKEVNVGRQRELDLVKGFLMIMIIFIHSFQTIGNMEAVTSNAHMVLFTLFMPTGACLYLFAMGFGSVFTRHSKPEDMVKNGVKLLLYQGLSNLCYAAAIVISFGIRNLIAGESAVGRCFRRDEKTGRLEPEKAGISCPVPVCIVAHPV